eukprot:6130408-Ditylum_brightwellii.AAC.1
MSCLDLKMHSDILQDLLGVMSFYTTLPCLKELFCNNNAVVDCSAQPNEAINNGCIAMAPKAINYMDF